MACIALHKINCLCWSPPNFISLPCCRHSHWTRWRLLIGSRLGSCISRWLLEIRDLYEFPMGKVTDWVKATNSAVCPLKQASQWLISLVLPVLVANSVPLLFSIDHMGGCGVSIWYNVIHI